MMNLMDNAMRRANSRLGIAQCEARDALLIEVARAVMIEARPESVVVCAKAVAQFIAALAIPVPVFDPTERHEYIIFSAKRDPDGYLGSLDMGHAKFQRIVVGGDQTSAPTVVEISGPGVNYIREAAANKRYEITIKEIDP